MMSSENPFHLEGLEEGTKSNRKTLIVMESFRTEIWSGKNKLGKLQTDDYDSAYDYHRQMYNNSTRLFLIMNKTFSLIMKEQLQQSNKPKLESTSTFLHKKEAMFHNILCLLRLHCLVTDMLNNGLKESILKN